MIQRLAQTSLSFRAKDISSSPRDTYKSEMDENSKIAQQETRKVMNMSNQTFKQIPMQGAGQKLDVIA